MKKLLLFLTGFAFVYLMFSFTYLSFDPQFWEYKSEYAVEVMSDRARFCLIATITGIFVMFIPEIIKHIKDKE